MLEDFCVFVQKEYPNCKVDIDESLNLADLGEQLVSQEYDMTIEDVRNSYIFSDILPVSGITVIILIGEFADAYNVQMDRDDVRSLDTVGDLLNLIKEKKNAPK